LDIDIFREKDTLALLRDPWNSLLDACVNRDVLFSHEWFSCWVDCFIREREMLIVVARESDRIKAILPLMRGNLSQAGLKSMLASRLRIVKSMTNLHSLRFDYITDSPSPRLLGHLIETAFQATGYKLIVLEKVPEGSLVLRDLDEACDHINCRYLVRVQYENCVVKKESTFDAYLKGLSLKFRKNVRAAERKARKGGPLTLLQPVTEEGMDDILQRCLAIETRSWKGRNRIAITCDQKDEDFIRRLSSVCFRKGWLELFLLKNAKDDLAFLYCLGNFGTVRAMRTAYDERFKSIGPGMNLIKKVLEMISAGENYHCLDFGCGWARWKNNWATGVERHYKVFVFKSGLIGKGLHFLASAYDKKHPYSRPA